MKEPIYLELVEKMLSLPELTEQLDPTSVGKLKQLLTRDTLPTNADLAAVLGKPAP